MYSKKVWAPHQKNTVIAIAECDKLIRHYSNTSTCKSGGAPLWERHCCSVLWGVGYLPAPLLSFSACFFSIPQTPAGRPRSRKTRGWRAAGIRQCGMESFFGTLKTELAYHEDYHTRSQAKASVFEYVAAFYPLNPLKNFAFQLYSFSEPDGWGQKTSCCSYPATGGPFLSLSVFTGLVHFWQRLFCGYFFRTGVHTSL